MKHLKLLVALALSKHLLFAEEFTLEKAIGQCRIPYSVMYAFANVESGYHKGGYPFVIGLNTESDIKTAKKNLANFRWLEARTLDCEDSKKCTEVAEFLIDSGIENFDAGIFQINHKWHHQYASSPSDYFDIPKSYQIACNVITDCVKVYGYGWKGISCYHSRTPKHNKRYAWRIHEQLILQNQGEKK